MKLSTSQKTKKKKNLKYSANKISPPRYAPAPSCAAPPVAHVHAWLHPPPAAAALLTSAQQKHSSPAGKKKKPDEEHRKDILYSTSNYMILAQKSV